MRFIRKAQSLGFSLDEIRRIISLRGHGKETCRCVIAMAEATLAETETKLKELPPVTQAGADVMKRIATPMIGGVVTSAIPELLIYPVIYVIWKRRDLREQTEASSAYG